MIDENEQISESILYAESIFGANERRGLVKLSCGISFEIITTPGEARMYALSILEACESAETDEFLMKWLQGEVGVTEDVNAVKILRRFREMRLDFRQRDLDDAKGEK